MWKLLTRFIAILMWLAAPQIRAEEVFDRYIGTLELRHRGLKQLAKMDFITFRDIQNKLKIKAVLSLYFGGFDSTEYVSYHFDDVEFNLLNQSLTFSQDDQDLTLSTNRFDGYSFEATARSARGRRLGVLRMSQDDRSLTSNAGVSALGGQYNSYCNSRRSYLNLQTYRSTADTVRVGNPFGAYKIAGQFGAQIPRLCRSSRPCVTNQIKEGSYNFFNGQLTLYGSQKTEQCLVNSDGSISCSSCTYRKSDQDRFTNIIWPRRDPFRQTTNTAPQWSQIRQGEYFGYLFHERRQMMQRMSFDVISYQDDDENKYLLSSVANLYFGGFESNEVLSYRFEDQPINLLAQNVVLQRTEDDVDAILKITEVGQGYIKGVWYSILFGRVGTFFVAKDNPPNNETSYPVMRKLRDEYISSGHFLDLDILVGQAPVNTENPFFPLTLSGYFSYRSDIASRLMITGGSYDFYTGKIGFEINDSPRVFTGLVGTQNMDLRWVSNGFATVIQDFEPSRFYRKVND